MRADLHVHSIFSDGSDFPSKIVAKAKKTGLDCIAITDHDTVKGVQQAVDAGKKYGVRVVRGIELSTYAVSEVHILGYGIDTRSDALLAKIDELEKMRNDRIKAILAKLKQFNIELDEHKIFDREGIVGRMHIAKELLAKGYCTGITEAFDRYLGERGSAYIPSKRITPLEGVKLIKEAKGVAVIAHPLNFLQRGKLNDFIQGLKPYGLDGIEVYYPTHTADDIAKLQSIATQNRLLATGGTDYHGENKKGVELGSIEYRPDKRVISRLKLDSVFTKKGK